MENKIRCTGCKAPGQLDGKGNLPFRWQEINGKFYCPDCAAAVSSGNYPYRKVRVKKTEAQRKIDLERQARKAQWKRIGQTDGEWKW